MQSTYRLSKYRRGFGILFLVLACAYAHGINDKNKIKADSLYLELSRTEKESEKMYIYDELAFLYIHEPEEVGFLEQLYNSARSIDSMKYVYGAISSLTRYYVNTKDRDELMFWIGKLDSISEVRNEVPENVYGAHSFLCSYYINNGEYELAMNETVLLQLLAEREHDLIGQIYGKEALGNLYLVMERYQEAIQAFEECLELLKSEKNRPKHEMQVMMFLLETYRLMEDWDKIENMLGYYAEVLSILTSDKVVTSKYVTRIINFQYYISRLTLHIARNKEEIAAVDAQKAFEYLDENPTDSDLSIYSLSMAYYYVLAQKNEMALESVKKAIYPNHILEALQLQISILKSMGRQREALIVYNELLEKNRQINEGVYVRQVKQLNTLDALNEEKMRKLQLKSLQDRIKYQQSQLVVVSIAICIVLAFIMLLYLYSVRTRKLKNVLEIEKKNLKETNESLVLAKEKAERADRLKSNFIANITHEIRTPLNAIVGFADLLAFSEEEEKREYIQIINSNVELLLNLVNDVLNLSILESDSFKLDIQNTDIQSVCRNSLESVRHRLVGNVGLKLLSEDSLYLNTDPSKLQQLLVNLLINATKYTEVGAIHLKYHVDQSAGVVLFTVTDTGCGVPADKAEIIFERFEKVNDFKQGAGLGLAICRMIADLLHGRIFVDSSYTDGARFVFIHPLDGQQNSTH